MSTNANGQKQKATARTPSSTHARMTPVWRMMDTLLGGTEAMRAAGETYLPRYEEESVKNYENRLARSVLLNMTEQVLDGLAGKPFASPVVLEDDVPAQIVELCEDVDLQGHNLQAFARNWFRVGWAKGLSHALVEFPLAERRVDEAGNPVPRTLADDRAENLRPYLVHVLPENLLAAYAETVNGQERLTHVRILETTVVRDGYEEVVQERVRVIERDRWMLLAPPRSKKPDDDWEVVDEGPNELGEIALVTFYAGKRVGLMECKPPLEDLAHLNVAHWQSASDQRNILSVARFPMLAGAGVPDEAKITVGPNNYLVTPDPQGKWYYVEPEGNAIEAGHKDLEQLKEEMAGYGAEFLKKRPGNESEGSRKLDSSEASSYLNATVQAFQDCLEQALLLCARWLNLEDGGSVVLSTVAEEEEADPQELDALNKARASRDISRFTYTSELKRRGVLSEDYDYEADQEKLADEAPEGMTPPMGGGPEATHPNGQPKFDAQGNALDENGDPVEVEEEPAE